MTIVNSKILITGTPRTGTTFLVQLYHELGFKTGFPREFHAKIQNENHATHGGIELARDERRRTIDLSHVDVVKHPWTMGEKAPWNFSLIKEMEFTHVLITKRPVEDSVRSMERRESTKAYGRGVRFDARSVRRKEFFIAANEQLRKHYPKAIEIKFPLSVHCLEYLYDQLRPTLPESVSIATFETAWRNIARPDYVDRP